MSVDNNDYWSVDEKTIQGSVECFLGRILDRVVQIDENGPFLDRIGTQQRNGSEVGHIVPSGNLPLPSLSTWNGVDERRPVFKVETQKANGFKQGLTQYMIWRKEERVLRKLARKSNNRTGIKGETQKFDGLKQGLTHYKTWRKEERKSRKLTRKTILEKIKKSQGKDAFNKNLLIKSRKCRPNIIDQEPAEVAFIDENMCGDGTEMLLYGDNKERQSYNKHKTWRKEERKSRKLTRKTILEKIKKSQGKDALNKNLLIKSRKCRPNIIDQEPAEVAFIDENMCGDGTEMLLYGDNKERQSYNKHKSGFWKRVTKSAKRLFHGDKTTMTTRTEKHEEKIHFKGGRVDTPAIESDLEIKKKTFGDKLRKVFGRRSVHT